MKWGTFIAVDRKKNVIKGANLKQMVMEEYMQAAGVEDTKDIIGPFETFLLDGDDEWRHASDHKLHEEALKQARWKQHDLAQRLKSLEADWPISLAEHCEKESGHKIGTPEHRRYMMRYYGHD